MEVRRLPVSDKRRQAWRDDRLWKREQQRAEFYKLKRVRCPCSKCKGRVQRSLEKVQDHLIQYDREPTFRLWRGPGDRDSSDEEWEEEFKIPRGNRFDGSMDAGLDVRAMVEDAFQEIDTQQQPMDETIQDIVMDAFTVVDGLDDGVYDDSGDEADEEPMGDLGPEDERDDAAHDLEEAIQELYDGAKSSVLVATILIMTLCTIHGVSNKFADSIFALFRLHILPDENRLPKNYHAAKSLIRKLGLNYNTIHACVRGCVLFRGPLENASRCPKCNAPRYKDAAQSKIPRKVLRHFPLIPRLKRMFRSPAISELMVWHSKNRSTDGMIRHPCDSRAWHHVHESVDSTFGHDPRNVHMGLATDGVNPFKLQRSTWSTWPVMLLNYNIPPWLTTKKFFIMLVLLIPGKQSVTGQFFDVYLAPLVEELQHLWRGVLAYDILKEVGSRTFNLRAILLWTIHDFPRYGTVAGVAHQGYVACPVCGPEFKGEHSIELGKQTYTDTRRWLPHDDPWRSGRMKDHFNGRTEERGPPTRVSAEVQLERAVQYQEWLGAGNRDGSDGDPSKMHGVKRRSLLHDLPYWKVLFFTYPH